MSAPSAADDLQSFLAQRLLRQEPAQRPKIFLVAPSCSTEAWRGEGGVLYLVPGLAQYQVSGSANAPLVIDERCLDDGPWSGTAGATGEGRLAELEAIAAHVRGTADSIVGVISGDAVPDVNLRRLRALYDLRIDPREPGTALPEPRLLQFVRAVLGSEKGGAHV